MSNEVVRWEPFNERVSLRDAVNRLFEDSFIQPGRGRGPLTAATSASPPTWSRRRTTSSSSSRRRVCALKRFACQLAAGRAPTPG